MNFKHLPNDVKQAIKALTTDQEFQDRFAKDKILDQLEAEKYNSRDEYLALLTVLNKKIVFNNLELKTITPAIWSFLYISKSPFVSNKGNITTSDVDFVLYILANGLNNVGSSSQQIYMNSIGFCQEHNINVLEAAEVIIEIIKISFRPLKMFPTTYNTTQSSPRFDADWLTGIVAKVHQVTGLTPREIINQMSLTQCCYYFAQYARMNSTQEIHMRSDEEIIKAMGQRTVELILQRLLEINIIKNEDVQKYRLLMNTYDKEVK